MTLFLRRLTFCAQVAGLLPVWFGGIIALTIVSTLTGRSAGDDVGELCSRLAGLTAREWPRLDA